MMTTMPRMMKRRAQVRSTLSAALLVAAQQSWQVLRTVSHPFLPQINAKTETKPLEDYQGFKPITPKDPTLTTYALFAALSVWVVIATAITYGIAWSAEQASLRAGAPWPWYNWPVISWGHGLALAVPILLLIRFTSAPRFLFAYQTWSLAALWVFAFGFVRALPASWISVASLVQIILSGIALFVLLRLERRRRNRIGWSLRSLLTSLTLVPIIVWPSFKWGALLSVSDALFSLLAGVALGVFAGILLEYFFFQRLAVQPATPGWDMLFGGWVSSVTLLMLGSGFGLGGSQLVLLIALSPLGFVVAGIKRFARRGGDGAWMPFAVLIGLCAAIFLMFFHLPSKEGLMQSVGLNDLWQLPWLAMWLSGAMALLVAGALWLLRQRVRGPARWSLTFILLAVAWISALMLAWS
jgi:hypothetical protein